MFDTVVEWFNSVRPDISTGEFLFAKRGLLPFVNKKPSKTDKLPIILLYWPNNTLINTILNGLGIFTGHIGNIVFDGDKIVQIEINGYNSDVLRLIHKMIVDLNLDDTKISLVVNRSLRLGLYCHEIY